MIPPQIRAGRAFVRTGAFWKMVIGFGVVATGILVAKLNVSYQPSAAIIIVIGVIVFALGVMSAKTPVDRVVYQT